MIYPEYEKQKQLYRQAQTRYESVLKESELLFDQTQPNGIDYGRDRVTGGASYSPFDRYLTEKDRKHIDDRLRTAKRILCEREAALELKRRELRASDDLEDRIYVLRYIERKKVYQIAMQVNYSESQVYRILKKLEKSKR